MYTPGILPPSLYDELRYSSCKMHKWYTLVRSYWPPLSTRYSIHGVVERVICIQNMFGYQHVRLTALNDPNTGGSRLPQTGRRTLFSLSWGCWPSGMGRRTAEREVVVLGSVSVYGDSYRDMFNVPR